MKCEICQEREATVHLTEVINDKVAKLHLCEICAKEKSEEMQSHFGLTDLLAGLMDINPSIAKDPERGNMSIKCPQCGMTYQDFQNTGKLGCGECYETFKDELSGLLRKIHGSDRHVGKMPFMGEKAVDEQETLQRLRNELDELIRSEEFEKAVIVRDRIKNIEEKLNRGGDDGAE